MSKTKTDEIAILCNKLRDSEISTGLNAINNILTLYKEYNRSRAEIENIRSRKEILLSDIKERYSFYKMIFEKVFDERQQAINMIFKVIETGLQNNDNLLIQSGITQLANIVTTSPFYSVQEVTAMIESGKSIDLDNL